MALNAQQRQGVLLFGIVGVVVAAVLGAFVYVAVGKKHTGPDNCVYEDKRLSRKVPSAQTVIVLDQSETLSPSHKRQVKELLIDFIADEQQLPIGSAVMLYVFGKNDFVPSGAGQSLAPNPKLCRPPSSGNEVYENKRKIERTFRDRFLVPLYGAVDKQLDIALGERSPILEMLQYLSRTQDLKEHKGHSKNLILVSDLLQHSEHLSHYKGGSYEDFIRSTLKSDLRGWNVRLLYLQRYGRDKRLQNKDLENFWMRYFHDAGAKISKFERIP